MEVPMEDKNKLALIISYYLSKYDRRALKSLGYNSFTDAFKFIGAILDVKPNTIKNMREHFDPLHPNSRVGWYQRELPPSRLEVIERYGHLSEETLTSIALYIINNYDSTQKNMDGEIKQYTDFIEAEDDNTENINRSMEFTTRGITGKRAEDLFLQYFKEGQILNLSGNLLDRTNAGCGYDYEMENEPNYVFEVKGLLDKKGGVMLTEKEWSVAKEMGEQYFLVLISNIDQDPLISIYQNPSNTFNPIQRVSKVITINWSIDAKQLFT
jgi:hypothetical protein